MAEALTAAQALGAAIAVSRDDIGPNLKAAAEHEAGRVPHWCIGAHLDHLTRATSPV